LPLQDDQSLPPKHQNNDKPGRKRSKRSANVDMKKIKNKDWMHNINGNLYEHIKAALQTVDENAKQKQPNETLLIKTNKSSKKRRDLQIQVNIGSMDFFLLIRNRNIIHIFS
jgi:hypothetical protein